MEATMKAQIFVASTVSELATLNAALLDGHLDAAERRILVVDGCAVTELLDPFDAVRRLPQAISQVRPAADAWDHLRWAQLMISSWDLDPGQEIHLVLPSRGTEVSQVLAAAFSEATIDVYADGLRDYAPTAELSPERFAGRLDRLLYRELVPGLPPLVHGQWGVRPTPISPDAMRKVLARLERTPPWLPEAEPRSVGLVIGQDLADRGLLTPSLERAVFGRVIQDAAARPGVGKVVFVIDPDRPGQAEAVVSDAARHGLAVSLHRSAEPPESWFAHPAVGFVGGCFHDALVSAARLYGLPVEAIGVDQVIRRLPTVEDSDRIVLVLVDQLCGDPRPADPWSSALDGPSDSAVNVDGLGLVLKSVAYGMRPTGCRRYQSAASHVATADPTLLPRYLPRARLVALGLAGLPGLTVVTQGLGRLLGRPSILV
jgi:hypothetical protein